MQGAWNRRERVLISIHALREEGDVQGAWNRRERVLISIHALREEGDVQGAWNRRERVLISIHALREEGDPVPHAAAGCCRYFYPRPPRGGRPELQCCCTKRRIFLSTPSARRATSFTLAPPSSSKFLSTPSARRATSTTSPRPGPGLNFYPRPPRGGRPRSRSRRRWTSRFLSTPSARRATDQLLTFCGVFDISIHALREEGDYRHHGRRSSGAISIHALREEGDLPVKPKRRGDVKFLSTPSARRATKLIPTYSPDIAISIHALREEGDDNRLEYEVVGHGFLSTPSARRATRAAIKQLEADIISIHALREEGDHTV